MTQIDPDLMQSAEALLAQVRLFLTTLILPWRLYQIGMILTMVALSWGLAHLASARLKDWLRAQEGMERPRLRLFLLIDRKMQLILFTIMAWVLYAVMREMTWPSRSQLIGLAATIATAWVIIFFLTRLIVNRTLRRIVTWGVWIWVTLHLLDFLDPMTRFLNSLAITFGDFRLSALTIIKALAVTGLLIAGARLLSRGVIRRLSRNEDISPTVRVLVAKLLQVVLFTAAVLIGLKAVGFDLTGLAVFSGAVGVGLGFGLQKVVSNLVSGVIILLDKSIKPGDVISIGDTFGWIEELGARYVSVVTRDGKEYLIPNEDLVTGQVVNWSHSNEFVRLDLHFGTSYHDDPHLVSRVAIEAAMSVGRVMADRRPVCWITGFGDSSIDYVLRFWITDAQGGLTNVRGRVFLALWDAFKAHGISIPFPQREVRVLNAALPRNVVSGDGDGDESCYLGDSPAPGSGGAQPGG